MDVLFFYFFKSLSTAAICREKQYPSSQHPSTVCHILPCTRRWQPCPYLRTAQITIPSPICPLSYIIKDQAGISLQSGSFHRVGGLCITAAWVIKQMSVVVSLYASQVSDCQKVPQVSAWTETQAQHSVTTRELSPACGQHPGPCEEWKKHPKLFKSSHGEFSEGQPWWELTNLPDLLWNL